MMSDQICDNCGNGNEMYGVVICQLSGDAMSAGNSCDHWQPRAGRAASQPVTVTAPETDFDIEAAARKIIAARLPEISISTVRDALHCQYRQAALVVEFLRSTERIRERGD